MKEYYYVRDFNGLYLQTYTDETVEFTAFPDDAMKFKSFKSANKVCNELLKYRKAGYFLWKAY